MTARLTPATFSVERCLIAATTPRGAKNLVKIVGPLVILRVVFIAFWGSQGVDSDDRAALGGKGFTER
jgi:hypothetical protein